jgi:hypothetical protein
VKEREMDKPDSTPHDWDGAIQALRLVDASDVAHDTPAGSCWHCRQPIDYSEAASWVRLGQSEIDAHVDCHTLFEDSPTRPDRREYDSDADAGGFDAAGYFEELENFVVGVPQHHYMTAPHLQDRLDAMVTVWLREAIRELTTADNNPFRRAGESGAEYLYRLRSASPDPADDADDDQDDPDQGGA